MALSTSAANSLLNHMFQTKGIISSSSACLWGEYIWLALFNGDPTSSGVEVSGSGYQRVLLGQYYTSGSGSKPACHMCAASTYTDKSIENVDSIMFDLAEDNWGTVTHFGIYGSSTFSASASDHTLIMSGALTSSVTINQGYIAMFKKRAGSTEGSLKITVS